MAMTITGRIHHIGSIQTITSKNGGQPFQKREIILDTTRFDPYTGVRDKFENYPLLEFSGEKCKDLDSYQVGQVVTISFDLQGSFYEDKDHTKKNFTKVRAYKIEARQMAANAPQPQQQPQPQAVQQQPVQQAQQYPPQGSYPPPPTASDLPW